MDQLLRQKATVSLKFSVSAKKMYDRDRDYYKKLFESIQQILFVMMCHQLAVLTGNDPFLAKKKHKVEKDSQQTYFDKTCFSVWAWPMLTHLCKMGPIKAIFYWIAT